MTYTKFALFIFSFFYASASFAANKNTDRWFEIEVILFSQLGDKSTLKESFPEADDVTPLPKYQKVVDLLAPYLQPDIASLKQLLPHCENPHYPKSFLNQASKPAPLFVEQSLTEFAEPLTEIAAPLSAIEPLAATEFTDGTSLAQDSNNGIDAKQNTLAKDFVASITPEQQALVSQAQQAFSSMPFFPEHFLAEQAVAKGKSSIFCQIPAAYFSEIVGSGADTDHEFSYHGFPVVNVPNTINNAENIHSEQAYLISKNSLQLHDIVKQLKLSRSFRPLLHIGWRQAPQGKKHAEAYKIYAGDHLSEHYQQAMAAHQAELDAALIKEQPAFEQRADIKTPFNGNSQANGYSTEFFASTSDNIAEENNDNLAEAVVEQQQIENAVAAKIADVISQVKNIDDTNINDINAALDAPEQLLNFLPFDLPMNIANPPVEPQQPWYLDGLFRVHLNHYLYITADFTVMNHTLAEQATHALKSAEPLVMKPIRFAQNKRVISGEIHYFDHPYIGMIVQIRKHKRPEQLNNE